MPTADKNTDPPERDGWLDLERRPLLSVLGTGGVLSLGSSVATAHSDDDVPATGYSGDAADRDVAEIDPYYGFATPDADEIPETLAPDSVVELHSAPPEDPENPDRPPLFHFEPTGLHLDSGDIVAFVLDEPDHSITTYHPAKGFQQRVPDGVAPFSSPVLSVGAAWLYRFGEEGVYDLYCGPHHVFGMNMRIVVGDIAETDLPDYVETFEGSEDPPLLAPFSKEFLEHDLNAPSDRNEGCEWPFLTPQEVLSADALDPMHIQTQGSVPFAEVFADVDRVGGHGPRHDTRDETGAATTPTVQVHEHD
ncbi:cupredoxin domain-containing protein [Halopiger djelfimassiliensis]|uniref:cupredoxin domain-containing protein n=1 Tax=Halopiger djelfimassiliensis TaxID=1293047 RepID=UPI0006778321|nr:plastocyanin/azurin family copper-binding protein [Halopiger djelfimassiliensis]